MTRAAASALDDVRWDLSHLLEGDGVDGAPDEAAVGALLDRAEELAETFARAYEGHVEELDGPGLVEAMRRLAEISELAGRAANFAHLRFAADTEDPANGALMQAVSERGAAIQTKLLFLELEWVQVPDGRAEEPLETDGLEFCRHHLRMERRYRPHLLSKPEETIATELSVTARRPGRGCSMSSPRRSGWSSPIRRRASRSTSPSPACSTPSGTGAGRPPMQ
jgi:oligoendopeptidase F